MQLSKYFTDKVKWANWYTTISYLINVFDKISGDTKKDLLISNLKIDLSTISLQWEVVNMDRVYASGWIIDRFQTMNFITEVDIPTYTKSPSGTYTFDLDAKIKNNDTGRSQ